MIILICDSVMIVFKAELVEKKNNCTYKKYLLVEFEKNHQNIINKEIWLSLLYP